jgi:SAM-dependent methyltransferase
MREWIAFWDSNHSIYVNDRHRDVHYRGIARDLRAYVPSTDAVVLDYGCGEALHADELSRVCGRLILCDAAPGVRAGLAERYADHPKIEVKSPEEVAALPDESIDLVSMVSVAQYLSEAELGALLQLFRRVLKPNGRLVIADIVPPDVSPVTDAAALLRFAKANGFLTAALAGLARTAVSDYRKLRTRLGLTHYTEAAMLGHLAAAGFAAQRQPGNVGHNPARMTFLARRG